MQTMTREDQLVAAVLNCCRLRDAWLETGVPRISNDLAEAVDELIEVYSEGDIPGECRPLFAVFPALHEEWMQFSNYMSEKQPSPKPMFWNQLQLMEKLLQANNQTFELPEIEGILELTDGPNPVSDYQVAMIYSHKGYGPFMDPPRVPKPSLVRLEYKHQKNFATRKDCETCQKIDKQLEAVPEENRLKARRQFPSCKIHGMQILPDTYTHPAAEEMRKAGLRIEKRLAERAARLSGNGHVTDDYFTGHAPGEPEDQVDESLSTTTEGGTELDGVSETELVADVTRLIGVNPNVSNRDIADTLGCTIKDVQRIRRKITG